MPDAVDIAACVAYLYPDPCFKGSATIADFADWASREWLDGRGTKPTQAELEAVWPAVQLAQLPVSDVDRLAETLSLRDEETVLLAVDKADVLRAARG